MRSNQNPVNSNSINKRTRLSLESDAKDLKSDTNPSKSQKKERKKEKEKKRNTFKRPALSKPDKV